MYQLFPWMCFTLLSVTRADHIVEQQNNSCGILSLISSECKRSDVILRYTSGMGLNISKVQWKIAHFRENTEGWIEAYNSSALSIFANNSEHYIVWRTREKERRITDFLIFVYSQPVCSEVFTYIRVRYKEFKDCITNGISQATDTIPSTSTPKVETKKIRRTEAYTTPNTISVTLSTDRTDDIDTVTKGADTTESVTQRTTSTNSGIDDVNGTGKKKLESNNEDKQEENESKEHEDRRTENNGKETNSNIGSNEQNTQDDFDQGTIATKEANTAHRNDSHILTVILATLGGFMCVVVIVIAVLVYRKKKGNKPQEDTGDCSLQQDAQRERGVRNGYEFNSQDTPEVLYAQVEKKHKTLQNASLAAQLRTNETDRHDGNVQQTETVTLKEEETMANVTTNKSTEVSNNEDNKPELVYIQLDMDHLNKSSTQRKSAERNDEDKTEYVGIDFAKTSQIQAN